MRLLLDTHVVLWGLGGTRSVGPRARAAIEDASELLFSVVSYAEIGVKAAVGKLTVPDTLAAEIAATGLRTLPLTAADGLAVADLPLHHRDPFDRLLVAQAVREGLTLVTADARVRAYDVSLIDAAA